MRLNSDYFIPDSNGFAAESEYPENDLPADSPADEDYFSQQPLPENPEENFSDNGAGTEDNILDSRQNNNYNQ